MEGVAPRSGGSLSRVNKQGLGSLSAAAGGWCWMILKPLPSLGVGGNDFLSLRQLRGTKISRKGPSWCHPERLWAGTTEHSHPERWVPATHTG